MCNLYSIMRQRAELVAAVRAMRDYGANAPPMKAVFPDYAAPVVLHDENGDRVVRDLRWGLPSSQQALFMAAKKRAAGLEKKGAAYEFGELLRLEPDGGTTNVRNTTSKHWVRWLGPENRCLVPFTSFNEPDQASNSGQSAWFALDESRPLAFFAGIHVREWSCVRKMKTGMETCDLFGFLTTDANPEVAAFHPKAMPVILTDPADMDLWMSDAPWPEVSHLQRPLPAGALKVVARGGKSDEVIPA